MADLLRLKGKQIGLGSLKNEHLATDAALDESKLSLDYSTSSLFSSINAINPFVALYDKALSVAIPNGVASVAVTTNVASAATLNTPTGTAASEGVVVTPGLNKCILRDSLTNQPIEESAGGADVYGRLTHDGTDYNLELYYKDSATGTETAFTTTAALTVDVLFPESFQLKNIPFNALANGAGFVDGLPAVHTHVLADITDITVSSTSVNDLATLTTLGATDPGMSGASLIGVDDSNLITIGGFSVQDSLETIDSILGDMSMNMGSDNLTAQVDDGDPAIFIVTQGMYIAGTLEVFVNGSKQAAGVQYNETDPGSGTFTFVTGAEPTGTDVVDAAYSYK